MLARQKIKGLVGDFAPPILALIEARNSLQMDERRVRIGQGESELRLVRHLCHKDKASIDVGANTGQYTQLMRKYSRRVISYEPIPELARLLRYKFNIVSPSRVTVRNCAVGNSAGHATLTVPRNAAWLATIDPGNSSKLAELEGSTAIDVEVVTLAEISDLKIGMIKIDVEGYEVEVLEGSLSLLERDHPNLLIESEERHRPGSLICIRTILEPRGYAGYFLMHGKLHDVADFRASELQNPKSLKEDGTDRLPDKTYINNFIFLANPNTVVALARALDEVGGVAEQRVM